MFQDYHWPPGFEFPACGNCNGGTTDDDLIVAMLARLDPFGDGGDRDGKLAGLTRAVNKQHPGLFDRMMPSATESRRKNRALGIRPPSGKTHQEAGPVKIPAAIDGAVRTLGRKLAKGVFYNATGRPFPIDGCLLMNWFTNADLIRDGKYKAFETLKELAGDVPALQRSGKHLNDQFEYKLSISSERDVFVLQAIFGKAFGVVIFGSTKPGLLETSVARLREHSGHSGPFAILQSPSLS